MQAEDNAGIGVAAGKPGDKTPPGAINVEPQKAPAADMVFDPLGVNKQGQRADVQVEQAQPNTDGGNATEMLFTAPLEVPKTGPGSTQVSATSEKQPETTEPIAPIARAYQGLGLHLTLFAAGSDGNGYDGVVIERAPTKPGKAAPVPPKPPAPKPAAPATAAPAPAPKPAPATPAPTAAPAPAPAK